jgi:hypothetical protein
MHMADRAVCSWLALLAGQGTIEAELAGACKAVPVAGAVAGL